MKFQSVINGWILGEFFFCIWMNKRMRLKSNHLGQTILFKVRFILDRFFGFCVKKLRFFGFCVKKLRFFGFGVHYGLRIFRFLAFGFRFSQKTPTGFRIWYAMRFLVFPIRSIWVPVFSSISTAITRFHWSWIAAKRKCYRHRKCYRTLREALPSPSPKVGGGKGRGG